MKDMQESQQKLERQLEQSRYWLRQAESKVAAIDIVKVPASEVAQLLLGFNIIPPESKTDIVSDSILVRGWVIGKNSPAISVMVTYNNEVLSQAPVNKLRAGVAERYPKIAAAQHSGFEIPIELTGMLSSSELLLQVVLEDRSNVAIGTIRPLRSASLECA